MDSLDRKLIDGVATVLEQLAADLKMECNRRLDLDGWIADNAILISYHNDDYIIDVIGPRQDGSCKLYTVSIEKK